MVMQSKSKNMTVIDDGTHLPFQLTLLVGVQKRPIPITHLYKRPNEIKNTIYEIEELVDLSIAIQANSSDPIQVNWGTTLTDTDEIKTINFNNNSDEKQLFTHTDYDEYPWRCGLYHFEVFYKNEKYIGAFYVKPRNITDDQLNKMHNIINQQLEGLALDYIHYKDTYSNISTIENNEQWQFINWLNQNERTLHHAIMMIEQNSQNDLTRTYKFENEPKHLDYRSIRWQNTSKGQMYENVKYMNRKFSLNWNSAANQFVKFHLVNLLNLIDDTNKVLLMNYKNTLNYFEQITKEIDRLIIKGQRIEQVSRITNREKRRIKNILKMKEIEQKTIEEQKYRAKKYLQLFKRSRTLLANRLYSSFWMAINARATARLIIGQHEGYQLFHKLWKSFHTFTLTNEIERVKLPVHKPTYLLYEYYVYFMTIHIFLQLQFDTKTDTVKDQLQSTFYEDGLKDGTTVTLQKDEVKIVITYDEVIEFSERLAVEKGKHLFSSSTHRKPDIRIDHYASNDGEWIYESSMILEVKYRPFYNIYNKHGLTSTMEQMDDYWSIRHVYVDEQNEKQYNHQPINNVFCVYPGQKDVAIKHKIGQGTFLQLYPEAETDELYRAVGKEELEKVILEWLGE